jgi:hypothetical protein
MAKILFLHGLAGRPGGTRVATLCESGHEVYAPAFPFAEGRVRTLAPSLVEQWRREGRVADPFPNWTAQAQDAYDDFAPDLVVGMSLGAALALRLDSGETPQVLVAPPWSGRVNVNTVVEQLLPPLPPATREWLPPLLCHLTASLTTKPAIKPATVVIHSPNDEVIDAEDSFRLLRCNPVPVNAHQAWVETLGRQLAERDHRPLFGRLVLAGDSHACDCAEGLKALADAADAALTLTVRDLVMA